MSSQARGLVRKFSNTVGATPKMNLKNDISDIYLLSSPTLFHRSLDVLLLFSCTYLVGAKDIEEGMGSDGMGVEGSCPRRLCQIVWDNYARLYDLELSCALQPLGKCVTRSSRVSWHKAA